ncbi:NAD(+)/NADH kinase [Helicobacter sp. 11S02629-2]|uniref:NAD(+)/NADH kinase n=1 Tax=Helicobacter sp. 11S02629-2 TaxID=1476195 RepID=UPI000BA77583|nr:NAD(+)/NADH kinase [Helicobacter sp. 11S02629-2]PAF43111.1 hypothetical protein BKH40_07285 [Helicobacter sp. 11S02629-2]
MKKDSTSLKSTKTSLPIKKVGITLRPNSPSIRPIYQKLVDALRSVGIKPFLEEQSATMLGYKDALSLEALLKEVDLLISIGGDGTLISLARNSYSSNIPILGIHTGHLGFLTTILPEDIEAMAKRLKTGEYELNEHMMLEGFIVREDKKTSKVHRSKKVYCLNEFLLGKKDYSMTDIKAYISSSKKDILCQKDSACKLINEYRLDSLLVATPTGSSAYNISAGGSVVYPYCKNILLTPVCAHSLTQRPLILDDSFYLAFKFNKDSCVVSDGQEKLEILKEEVFIVHSARHKAYLVNLGENYFDRLREKFGWGA